MTISCDLIGVEDVIDWLGGNDTGISSKNIAFEYLGNTRKDKSFAPLDPSDLGRCIRLIRKVPTCRSAIRSLGQVHKKWKILDEHFEELTALMEDEVGINWEKGSRAVKTYERMKELGL